MFRSDLGKCDISITIPPRSFNPLYWIRLWLLNASVLSQLWCLSLFCPKREVIDLDLWNGWMVDGVISQSWLSRSSGSCVTFVMSRWLATLPRLTRGAAKELDCRGIVRLNRDWGGVRRGGQLPCYNFVPKLYSFFYFIVSIIQSSVRLLRPNNGNICTFAAEMMCLKGSPPQKKSTA